MPKPKKTKSEIVRDEKRRAREALRNMKPFKLERDVFFVHGWGDEACICWKEPYMETGDNYVPGWGYTVKEWIDDKKLSKIENKEKVHYLSLMGDESKVRMWRNTRGKLKIDIDRDISYYFKNFFQFAELLKEKIRETKVKEFDVVVHSMGGLDAVTAIAINPNQDKKGFIKTEPLAGVNKLITVATPHRGSPAARYLTYKITELICHRSDYIKEQGKNMYPSSYFVSLVNELKARKQLLSRIKELHMFGGSSDIVVPRLRCYLKEDGLPKTKIKPYPRFKMARHSQRNGITQDPRLIFAVLDLLKK